MFAVVRAWGGIKDWLSATLHLSHAMLHIHVGLAVYLISARLMRRRLGSVGPVLMVLGLEVLNEGCDIARYWLSDWPWTPAATVGDLANTLAWPVIITLYCRARNNVDQAAATGEPQA